ncbi:MAG: hypothetical protein KAG12_02895, partial [Desulfuromusa sp.]|nr:hypothetical protein [Desulfuromusa sp.]
FPTDILEEAGFTFNDLKISSGGIISGPVHMDSRNIAGTGFGISGELILDFSTTESPQNGTLADDWMGVYITSGELTLPTNPLKISEITITDLYVDNGLNCEVSINNLTQTFSVGSSPTEFSGTLSGITLDCTNHSSGNPSFSGSLIGTMKIPYLDAEIATVIGISTSELALSISLTEAENIKLADTVTLNIESGSSVSFENEVLKAKLVTTITGLGDLLGEGVNADLGATLSIASNGKMGLVDTQLNVEDWIGLDNKGVDFMGLFSLQLNKIGFGIRNNDLFFGIGGGLTIMEGFKAEASATMGINLISQNIWAEDVEVKYEQAGAFVLGGAVSFLEGETYGSGFAGDINLTVSNLFSATSRLIVGHTEKTENTSGFPYFYMAGEADIGVPIQMTPYPLALYGFGGGAYGNMRAANQGDSGGLGSDAYPYTPELGSFGVIGKVNFGTSFDEGYTFNGDLSLKIHIATADDSEEGPGASVALQGEGYVLCERKTPNPNRKVDAEARFGCFRGNCVFSSILEINDFAIVDPDKALV